MGENGTGEPATKKAKADPTVLEQEFDKETQAALEEIDTCQNDIDAMNEKASEEILKVEQKYNTLRKPFFDKRNDIIKKIPKFWLTSFINHPQLSGIIEEDEEDALQYLSKLEVEEFEDIKSGYKINFHFDTNPYFENDILCKEYQLDGKGDPTSTSTDLKWKDGFDLTAKAAEKAALQKGQRKRKLENRTFFSWYCDNEDPSNDEIGEIIKDDMWPNPLQYFLVPDLEVENVEDEEDDDLGEEEEGENVVVLEEDEEEEGEEEGEADEAEGEAEEEK